ncbi:hypothetical protein ACROYT_G017098 [Oculina patagonica]
MDFPKETHPKFALVDSQAFVNTHQYTDAEFQSSGPNSKERKRKRSELSFNSQDQSQIHSSKIGVYWEFSYVYYDKETGNIERAEAHQPKPSRREKELFLLVTCRGEKPSCVDRKMTEKSVGFNTGRKAVISPKCNNEKAHFFDALQHMCRKKRN